MEEHAMCTDKVLQSDGIARIRALYGIVLSTVAQCDIRQRESLDRELRKSLPKDTRVLIYHSLFYFHSSQLRSLLLCLPSPTHHQRDVIYVSKDTPAFFPF